MGVPSRARVVAVACARRLIRAFGCRNLELMRKEFRKLLTAILLLSAAGLHSPVASQSRSWREIRGEPLVRFDWNCASPSAYPKAELGDVVRASARRESVGVEAEADRAFAFDLNGDRKPEYFVPLVCGATGNCDWGVFALNPARFLGIVNGQYIYVHRGAGRWPSVISYGHLSAAEGLLGTYRFSKGRYAHIGDSYPVGPEGRTLEIQNVEGRRMPRFLERARAACENLGW